MTDPDTYAAKLTALTTSPSSTDQVLGQAEVLYEAYMSEPSAEAATARAEALILKFHASADNSRHARAIIKWMQDKLPA